MITPDQVTALAPDAASYKAGKGLAVGSKWSELGHQQNLLWGLAKGSGKKPYQTQVALDDFASKCSCPSRKFPCKHALGLMFIAAQDSTQLTQSEAPDWVLAWQDARVARTEKTAKKENAAKPRNEQTAARTIAKRRARADEGVSFFIDFLLDLIRQGLAQPSVRDRQTWDDVAKRLIDYQVPGLARAATRLGDLAHIGTNWETHLLHEMGALYLLLHSFQKRSNLPAELCAEVEQRIGWQTDKDTVLLGHKIEDDWFVAFRQVTNEDRLTVYANWVCGRNSQQWALLLSFNATGAAPATLWPVGSTVSTTLAFYPGATFERAMPIDSSAPVRMDNSHFPAAETVDQLLRRISNTLITNPWHTRVPSLLMAQPTSHNSEPILVDLEGHSLPWQARDAEQLMLESICGGKPTSLAGVWSDGSFHVHSANDNGTWFQLRQQYP